MELAALGLTTNVLQIIDFSVKLVLAVREIKELGTTADFKEAEGLSRQLRDAAAAVIIDLRDATTADELAVLASAKDLRDCANKHLDQMDALRPRGGRIRRVIDAGNILWRDRSMANLSSQLQAYEANFQTQSARLMRKENIKGISEIKKAAEKNSLALHSRFDGIEGHLSTIGTLQSKVRNLSSLALKITSCGGAP